DLALLAGQNAPLADVLDPLLKELAASAGDALETHRTLLSDEARAGRFRWDLIESMGKIAVTPVQESLVEEARVRLAQQQRRTSGSQPRPEPPRRDRPVRPTPQEHRPPPEMQQIPRWFDTACDDAKRKCMQGRQDEARQIMLRMRREHEREFREFPFLQQAYDYAMQMIEQCQGPPPHGMEGGGHNWEESPGGNEGGE
ncbi:MAG: hypothetical protein HY608_12160, partial [Planctomycetes bacterium]|nr:hypothetical protein [Planctomycetota bacterium]